MTKKRALPARPRQTTTRQTTKPQTAIEMAVQAAAAQPVQHDHAVHVTQPVLPDRHDAPVPSDAPASPESELPAWLKRGSEQILAVTYWFDPAPQRLEPYPLTVRFVGRRADAVEPLQPGDRFTQDEIVEAVVPGSGPISVTARVHGVNPGAWRVTAQVHGPERTPHTRAERDAAPPLIGPARDHYPLPLRLWRRWAPVTGPSLEAAEPAHTCYLPFAPVPGLIPVIWAAMVALGMIIALATQSLVIVRDHLAAGPALTISLVAIAAGIAGAKGWFIVLYRRERRFEGWCIQGFVVAAVVTALILLLALRVSIGVFLDATAPGLLFAMAVGRVGCFFAGCCGGPPTAARWGVWSSDQRVGARRVPTQLLESALALSLGLAALAAVLGYGPANGAFFVAALAAYTLGRQGILRLRAEPRKTRHGTSITATLAALTLVADITLLIALGW